MPSIDTFIDFVEQLLQKDTHFLTSDEVHLRDVLNAFKLAKKDGKVDRKTLQQLVNHYRAAGDTYAEMLKSTEARDFRPISIRMQDILEKGTNVGPVEYYFTVASAIKYADLIYGIQEQD